MNFEIQLRRIFDKFRTWSRHLLCSELTPVSINFRHGLEPTPYVSESTPGLAEPTHDTGGADSNSRTESLFFGIFRSRHIRFREPTPVRVEPTLCKGGADSTSNPIFTIYGKTSWSRHLKSWSRLQPDRNGFSDCQISSNGNIFSHLTLTDTFLRVRTNSTYSVMDSFHCNLYIKSYFIRLKRREIYRKNTKEKEEKNRVKSVEEKYLFPRPHLERFKSNPESFKEVLFQRILKKEKEEPRSPIFKSSSSSFNRRIQATS